MFEDMDMPDGIGDMMMGKLEAMGHMVAFAEALRTDKAYTIRVIVDDTINDLLSPDVEENQKTLSFFMLLGIFNAVCPMHMARETVTLSAGMFLDPARMFNAVNVDEDKRERATLSAEQNLRRIADEIYTILDSPDDCDCDGCKKRRAKKNEENQDDG